LPDDDGSPEYVQFRHPDPRIAASGLLSVAASEHESVERAATRVCAPAFTLQLDAQSRLSLTADSNISALNAPPGSIAMAVLMNDRVYDELDSEIFSTFGKHLVVSQALLPTLNICLSDETPPPGNQWRHAYSGDGLKFMTAARRLDEFSDGIRMYVGLMLAVATTRATILLIDEPERSSTRHWLAGSVHISLRLRESVA
jgi:hypothetical protein